jgi:hypothetical protein
MKATTIGQALKLDAAQGDFEFDLWKGLAFCQRLVALPIAPVAVLQEDRSRVSAMLSSIRARAKMLTARFASKQNGRKNNTRRSRRT